MKRLFITSFNKNVLILKLISDWELLRQYWPADPAMTTAGSQENYYFFFPVFCPLKSPTIAFDWSIFLKEDVGGNKVKTNKAYSISQLHRSNIEEDK